MMMNAPMTHVINMSSWEKVWSDCLTIELMYWYSVKSDADTFHHLIFDQYQQGKQDIDIHDVNWILDSDLSIWLKNEAVNDTIYLTLKLDREEIHNYMLWGFTFRLPPHVCVVRPACREAMYSAEAPMMFLRKSLMMGWTSLMMGAKVSHCVLLFSCEQTRKTSTSVCSMLNNYVSDFILKSWQMYEARVTGYLWKLK